MKKYILLIGLIILSSCTELGEPGMYSFCEERGYSNYASSKQWHGWACGDADIMCNKPLNIREGINEDGSIIFSKQKEPYKCFDLIK